MTTDATQIEINPLALTDTGKVYVADAKLNFDDNAEYRQVCERTKERKVFSSLCTDQGVEVPRHDRRRSARSGGGQGELVIISEFWSFAKISLLRQS